MQPYISALDLMNQRGMRDVELMRQAQAMKLSDLQYKQAQEEIAQKKSLRDLLQAAIQQSITKPSEGMLGYGVKMDSPQTEGFNSQLTGDPEFDKANLQAINQGLEYSNKGNAVPISAPSKGGMDFNKLTETLIATGTPEGLDLGLKFKQMQDKDTSNDYMAVGDVIFDKKNNRYLENPFRKPEKDTSLVGEYKYAQSQGFKGSLLDYAKSKAQNVHIVNPPAQSAPVAIIGPDGKPKWVSREQAIGQTPAIYDPTLQGILAGERVEGKGNAERKMATANDQKAALDALHEAGYDHNSGKDKISALIEKSTSGNIQRGGAAIARAFDVTTEGMKALNTVSAAANKIVMKMMGGKLGAGISNADRDFISAQLGEVGNAEKTSEERLAAWKYAKDRMIEIGMLPVFGNVKQNNNEPVDAKGRKPLSSFGG